MHWSKMTFGTVSEVKIKFNLSPSVFSLFLTSTFVIKFKYRNQKLAQIYFLSHSIIAEY